MRRPPGLQPRCLPLLVGLRLRAPQLLMYGPKKASGSARLRLLVAVTPQPRPATWQRQLGLATSPGALVNGGYRRIAEAESPHAASVYGGRLICAAKPGR